MKCFMSFYSGPPGLFLYPNKSYLSINRYARFICTLMIVRLSYSVY